MSSPNQKALIIGGGIAGPVVALFLKRAGIASAIYEARSEDNSYTGAFLNLAGNGIKVLKALDVDKAVVAAGSPVPRMILWNGKGKRLGEVANGARNGLDRSVAIRRGDLQRALHEAAISQGIEIHFGRKLRQIEEKGQGICATFEDGTAACGDFLVGCDGVHSRTRQIINPGAPKPSYTGLISTGGFTCRPSLPPTPDTQHFIFGRRAFFGYHVRASGEIYWFNNHERRQEPDRGEIEAIPGDVWRQRLLAMHSDDLPLIGEIIGATEGDIVGYPIYDIASQPLWHKGAVVLVGDAVHAVSPSSGQGASLAMEDAGVLARCLRDIPDRRQAFALYERLRRERVERIVKWARRFGDNKSPATPFQAWFRDLMMPFFLKFAASPSSLDWLHDYQLEWDRPMARAVR